MSIRSKILLGGLIPLTIIPSQAQNDSQIRKTPNVIYIMADDLGIGDLGCYGQRQIKTPAIDQLASQGIRFTQHYSGSTVSAPSRAVLMTGKHTGHSSIRGNKGYQGPDGEPYDQVMPADEITVAQIFKQRDYATACIGKWGLGGPDSQSHPNHKGFDYFFGYLGQLHAHKYYPQFLHENNDRVTLDGKTYSHDMIIDKALGFIERNGEKPFFLYLSPTIPHAELLVPEGELGEYDGKFYETPYPGGHYVAQPKPRATFAAMVTRLDRDVQRIVDLLKEKGIFDNTIIIFTSDNGTHIEGGHDPEYFDSNGPFRGTKRDLYEGGVRTPFVVSWPAVISQPRTTYHVSAFWDFMPTVCDLLDVELPSDTDGISYLPTLTLYGEQPKHEYLYFEFHEQGGRQSILRDGWKLIRQQVNNPSKTYYELFNIHADPSETANVAGQYPEMVRELTRLMDNSHTPSQFWPFSHEK